MKVRKEWRRLRDPFVAAAAAAGVAVVGRMRYRHLRGFARLVGAMVYAMPASRRLIEANLAVAFPDWPEERRRKTARESAVNLCLAGLELAWFSKRPQGVAQRIVFGSPEARETLHQAIDNHLPMLVLTPHIGNWELSAQFACSQGMKLCAVARPFKNPGMEKIVAQHRTRGGLRLIPQKGAAKAIVQALKSGQSVGVLMDQNVREKRGGVFVDFFGLPVPTTRAPASLAQKLGVEAACFACIRRDEGFELHVKRLPKPVGEYADDISLTQDMLTLNEQFAREYPEQYLWLYERWRHLPDSLAPEVLARYPYYRKNPASTNS